MSCESESDGFWYESQVTDFNVGDQGLSPVWSQTFFFLTFIYSYFR